MRSCNKSIDATNQLGNRLASQLEAQIQELVSAVGTGQASQEQIVSLREMKAAIAERLHSTEASLVDSRLKATDIAKQEQIHLQKISALEAELQVLRDQPRESPMTALRLHDAEKQCLALKEQLTTCESQLNDTKADIETQTREKSELHGFLETTKAELAGQRAKNEALKAEKADIEQQALRSEERLRTELSQACQNEISRQANKSLNEIQSLRHKVSVTEKENSASKNNMEQLHREKLAALQDAEELESSINGLREQAEESQGTIHRLQEDIQKHHQERAQLENELGEAQHELRTMREKQERGDKVRANGRYCTNAS